MSLLEAVDTLTETRIDQLCIDTIRTLSIDAVHTETVLGHSTSFVIYASLSKAPGTTSQRSPLPVGQVRQQDCRL